MKKLYGSAVLSSIAFTFTFSLSQIASAACTSSSHPYECPATQACYEDEAQAISAGCDIGASGSSSSGSGSSSSGTGSSSSGSSSSSSGGSQGCFSASNPSHVVSGRRTENTQDWCDTNCVTFVGNGTGCLNKDNIFVANTSICSDAENAKQAILDIEFNLGIDVDDQFQAKSGYQGTPPSINPGMSYADALTYFQALLGDSEGLELTNALNTNGDGWIDRNEASAAKGADPRQILTTSFGCGLSTDDIMAYVGLYIGDGAVDKYAGDLDPSVKDNMLKFTRSWQPGTDVLGCEYRGGCNGQTPNPTPTPVATATPDIAVTPTPTPTPVSGIFKVEGESGVYEGTAKTYPDQGNASGDAGVGYLDGDGASVTFTNVPASSSMIVYYASQNSGAISVLVNGSDVADLSFTSNNVWTGSYTSTELQIAIPQNATVAIVNNGGDDQALNIDYIEFVIDNSTPFSCEFAKCTPTPSPTPATPTPTPTPVITPTPDVTGWEEVSFEDFEGGFVHWEDGGNDVFLRKGTEHRSSGANSANIQDGSGPKSTIRQVAFDATVYSQLEISFWYKPISMEKDEFFRIQFEEANGKWANLADYVKGVDFTKNGDEYTVNLNIKSTDYDFGSASRFRVRNFGNTNADDIYIDDILVRGLR